MIYSRVDELIGNTPLLELTHIQKSFNLNGKLLAKIELFNPAGSIKDRVAKNMIEDAEKKGILKEGSVIIEPTSGNTGIGLCAIAAAKGYKAIIVMPETMSEERKLLMKAFGAELVLTEGSRGMKGAIEKAEELSREIENSFIPAQFDNPANYEAHMLSTAPEIWQDTEGRLDTLIATVGTGGTITGIGKYLKSKNESIKIVAVEPEESAVLSGERAGSHGIQGIGAGFIPKVLDTEIYDEIIKVKTDDAYAAGALCAKTEGVLVGISSGACLKAGIDYLSRKENKGKTVVLIFPDTGDRYLSTPMFK